MAAEYDCDVIVVGAGCAGLSAARVLLSKERSCIVVEASSTIGGRVRDVEVSCGSALCRGEGGGEGGGDDLEGEARGVTVASGAEFVHGGEENVMLSFLAEAGVGLSEASWPDTYWLGKEGVLLAADEADAARPGLRACHEAFEAIVDAHVPGETLLQYWIRRGVESRHLDVADAVYANDYGAAASGLGAAEVAVEQRHWTHGEQYPLCETGKTLRAGVEALASGVDVRLDWPVATVYRDARGVSVRRRDGMMLRARLCVCAAPLGCLKAGLAFSPPLPERQRRAIDALPIANAVKAVVVLRGAIWKDPDWWNAVCGDALFPEVWRSGGPRGERKDLFAVVGFVTGDRADAIAKLGRDEAVRRLLRQLDDVFGSAEDPQPATDRVVGAAFVDWRSEEFARGGYTFPSPGCLPLRAALREPVDGTLFFAGEHVTEGINPCVQGAVASGFEAARRAHARLRGPGGATAASTSSPATPATARELPPSPTASPSPTGRKKAVRGPRVKCGLGGWEEPKPAGRPRRRDDTNADNKFDAAVTNLPVFDRPLAESTPLRHSKTSAKFPWNDGDGRGDASEAPTPPLSPAWADLTAPAHAKPRTSGSSAWGPHVDHPRERETMAPGRSPPRPPWHAPTRVNPDLRLPRGLAEDELPAFYH